MRDPNGRSVGFGHLHGGLLTYGDDKYSRLFLGPIVSLKMAMDGADEHKCSYR
jgi:hypothetical protein